MLQSIFLILSLAFTFSLANPIQYAKTHGLDPGRAPYAAVEAKILDARTCRDNYRIATNRTTNDLASVIIITQQCAVHAAYGHKYLLVSQNFSTYQLRLFSINGYTVNMVGKDDQEMPQFNITWRLLA